MVLWETMRLHPRSDISGCPPFEKLGYQGSFEYKVVALGDMLCCLNLRDTLLASSIATLSTTNQSFAHVLVAFYAPTINQNSA
jgi:hypothetical protein